MTLEMKKLRALRRSVLRSHNKLVAAGLNGSEQLLAEIDKRIAEEAKAA